jgi:hypothetical protein
MLLTLLVAQLAIVSSAPKIPPAEALAILARMDSPSNWTNRFICRDCDGPHVTVVPYHPDDGPFGRFPVYLMPPLATSSYYGSWYYGAPYASIYSYGTNIGRYRSNVFPFGRPGMNRAARGFSAPARMASGRPAPSQR